MWKEALRAAKNPVVLSSFGKDSVLVLDLARAIRPDVDVLWFRDERDGEAEKIIASLGLTVYSYLPSTRSVVPNGEGLSLINFLDFGGGALVPQIVDLEDSNRCVGELKSGKPFAYDWDVTITGWRESDNHPLKYAYFEDGEQIGNTRFYAPIRHLSDDEVYVEVKRRGLKFSAKQVEQFCTKCLRGPTVCPLSNQMIPAYKWQPNASLEAFRQRFTDAA